MEKKKDYSLLLLIIVFVLAIVGTLAFSAFDKPPIDNPQHTCIDNTHEICDGNCECDGLGCHLATNNNTTSIELLRAYQIQLTLDSIILWDGNRRVGAVFLTDDTPIGRLIYDDNE